MVPESTKIQENWSRKAFFLRPSFFHWFWCDFSGFLQIFWCVWKLEKCASHRQGRYETHFAKKCYLRVTVKHYPRNSLIFAPFLDQKTTEINKNLENTVPTSMARNTHFVLFFWQKIDTFPTPRGVIVLPKRVGDNGFFAFGGVCGPFFVEFWDFWRKCSKITPKRSQNRLIWSLRDRFGDRRSISVYFLAPRPPHQQKKTALLGKPHPHLATEVHFLIQHNP